MEINEKTVKKLIVDLAGGRESEIKADTLLVEVLSIDAIEGVEIVMSFELEFDLEISDEEADNLWNEKTTLKDVVEFLEKKRAG